VAVDVEDDVCGGAVVDDEADDDDGDEAGCISGEDTLEVDVSSTEGGAREGMSAHKYG